MRDLKHAPVTVVAGLVALAVIVWLLVTHLLAALAIVAVAGVLVVLLRHGDRLTVAWWPMRQQAQLGDGAAGTPETADRDEWL